MIRIAQNGVFYYYGTYTARVWDDGSALQIAILIFFVSYFGYGVIYGWTRTLINPEEFGSLFLGDPDG